MAELESFDETPESVEKGTHLLDYWAIVVKRRRLILVCLAAALVGGVLATLLTKPKYKATVTLDVERQTANPINFGTNQSLGGPDAEFLPSQIQLMQSREIGERIVRKLNLLADPDFNPKHFARFRPDAKGNVQKPTEEEIIDAALDVQGNIEATIVRATSLVTVDYTAPSPKLAANIANALADAYIDWNLEAHFRLLGQSAQFLGTQIEQAKAQVDEKENALLAFGRSKEIVPVESGSGANASPTLQKLDSVNRDLAAAVGDRVAKQAHYDEIRATGAESLADSSTGGAIASMRGDLQKLEREYADKLNVYKPEWPAMEQMKAQIDAARKSLQTTITEAASKAVAAARTEYLTALRREQSLKAMTKSQQTEALAQGGDEAQFKNLRVEIDTKRALLDNLLRQQGEAEVLSRLREDQFTSVRIVDRALPPGLPFKPSLKKYLLIAAFLGCAAGVGLAFLLSHLDRSLRTPDQVEQFVQLPSLGVVPALPTPNAPAPRRKVLGIGRRNEPEPGERKDSIALLPHQEPHSPVAESYRAFRTALLLSRAGGVKTVVVTSALPQEGKTTTAANLGVVLGQLGRRVLIVDADLHQPRMHEIFGIPNRVGLVSILAEGIEPSRAIVKTNVSGVFVVPSGPDAPNPSGLLTSDAMQKFLDLAASNFDHVVIDTPPVLLVSDTLVFAQQTDGVVLCMRGGKTSRDHVIRARDRILRSSIPILGVLINALEPQAGSAYEYAGYGYPRDLKAETVDDVSAPRIASTT